MAHRLTKRASILASAEKSDRFIWDRDLKGFGLKITPSGRKSFVAQYRNREDGRTRRLAIGTYGALTVEEARSQARSDPRRSGHRKGSGRRATESQDR